MDIKRDFPMLVYTIDACTEEGYRFISEDEGIELGHYIPIWLHIRTKVIDRYR